ncbi:beta strand repeat-containing protein [Rariglobus hedericola]|nr:autotransporter-associated beta strand repeat-containing protein [Rariglobus hedericola]
MKKLPFTLTSALFLLAGGVRAQNVWNGAGVTGGTAGTDWTAAANYTATPAFNATTDLKFSTITNASGGVTLSAGTGGAYAVKDLYFGDTTTLGSGQTSTQAITLNGNGIAGQTIIDLAGNIFLPSTNASKITLGADLTLNLSTAAHQINFKANSNVTTVNTTAPVLVVNALVTGGGASATFTPRFSTYGTSGGTAAIVLTNNNSSFVATQNRFDNYVGFTSIGNVGGGNSSMGNATTTSTGTISLGNGGNLNYIGTGDQSTDRNLALTSTNALGNSSVGTTLTYNGQMTAGNTVILRTNVIGGSTLVINSTLADGPSAAAFTINKQFTTTYYDTTGATASNDGTGTLVLGGDNTFTGAVNISAGTVRITHANGLGGTTGATLVSSNATLDLNGQTVGAEAVSLTGTGVGSVGALRNSSASAASLGGNVTLTGNTSIGATGTLKLTGVIGESGGVRTLTKIGTGELTLNGINTYTGTTTVSAGTLGGIGSISTGAATFATGTTLNPGDGATTGQFSFGGNLALSNDAIFSVSLNQSAGNGYDRVAVAGTTNITGSILSVGFGTSFDSTAQVGQTFSILTSIGTLTGQFDQGTSITATSGTATYDFGISYTGNIVTLTLNNISAIPEPSTWALIAGAASMLAVVARRRRHN